MTDRQPDSQPAASDSSSARVVPNDRVSCWRRPGVVALAPGW